MIVVEIQDRNKRVMGPFAAIDANAAAALASGNKAYQVGDQELAVSEVFGDGFQIKGFAMLVHDFKPIANLTVADGKNLMGNFTLKRTEYGRFVLNFPEPETIL